MANSKYNEEIEKIICDAIATAGTDKAGYKAGSISKECFYSWMRDNQHFSDSIHQSRIQFRNTVKQEWVVRAKQEFEKYLYGLHEEIWETTEITEDGDKIIKKTVIKKIRRGTPPWCIERVLGDYRLLEAMQELLTNNIATVEQAAIVRDGIQAIENKLFQLGNPKPQVCEDFELRE